VINTRVETLAFASYSVALESLLAVTRRTRPRLNAVGIPAASTILYCTRRFCETAKTERSVIRQLSRYVV